MNTPWIRLAASHRAPVLITLAFLSMPALAERQTTLDNAIHASTATTVDVLLDRAGPGPVNLDGLPGYAPRKAGGDTDQVSPPVVANFWARHSDTNLAGITAFGVIALLAATVTLGNRRLRAERLRATMSEARYRGVLDALIEGVVMLDARGVIVASNPAAERILGLSQDEMRGRASADPSWLALREDGTPYPGHEHPSMIALRTGTAQRNVVMGLSGRDERKTWILINAQPLWLTGGATPDAVVSSFIDISERKEREQVAEAYRESLIREVHHRIKNNLQSVAGLLRRELGKHLERDERLAKAITQVNAIAVVHGLQGTGPGGDADLRALIANIRRGIEGQTDTEIEFEDLTSPACVITLDKNEAVSIALILNELILNAVKHRVGRDRAPTLKVEARGMDVAIVIGNPCLPDGRLDYAAGRGLGTGLSLARALLPTESAELDIDARDDLMVTEIRLRQPLARFYWDVGDNRK